ADGLFLILAGGGIASILIWLMAKFASTFRQQTFFNFTASVLSKPIAVIICFLYAIHYILLAAYEVRKLTDITQHYLLEETPMEVLALAFLLVVMYAVSGSRAGIFRLNAMFMPFVLVISLAIMIFNIQLIETSNLFPVFKTSASDNFKGLFMMIAIFIVGGVGVVLFYSSFVESNTKLSKLAVAGTGVPVLLFFLFYFVAIGVFGNNVTGNLLYASVELGKAVEIPGGVLERFESIFFVIWIMTIFNLSVMITDISVVALQSIFTNVKKIHLLLILTPIIFFISMLPHNVEEIGLFGKGLAFSVLIFSLIILPILFIVSKIRGVKADE